MKKITMWFIVFLVLSLLSYGAWRLQKWWNYSWGYQSQVQSEICVMVKPENLTDEGKATCN